MKPCNFYNGENMFRIFFIQRMVDCGQNLLIFKDMMKNEFNGEVIVKKNLTSKNQINRYM